MFQRALKYRVQCQLVSLVTATQKTIPWQIQLSVAEIAWTRPCSSGAFSCRNDSSHRIYLTSVSLSSRISPWLTSFVSSVRVSLRTLAVSQVYSLNERRTRVFTRGSIKEVVVASCTVSNRHRLGLLASGCVAGASPAGACGDTRRGCSVPGWQPHLCVRTRLWHQPWHPRCCAFWVSDSPTNKSTCFFLFLPLSASQSDIACVCLRLVDWLV